MSANAGGAMLLRIAAAAVVLGAGIPLTTLTAQEAPAIWSAGAAQRRITPQEPLWLSGYASRTKPASGKLNDLWVRALALEAPGSKPLVLVTLDLVGIDREHARNIRQRLAERHGLADEQVALCCSHTHSGPIVGHNLETMYFLDAENSDRVARYTPWLTDQIVETVGEALAARRPCRLSTGRGASPIAVNRRNNPEEKVPELRAAGQLRGPVDHDVHVLRVASQEGQLVAVVFGYACHATVLDGYEYCGDYPGMACDALAEAHLDAVPLFWAGCGGDQNPIPRRKVELAREYGRQLAGEVDRVLAGAMSELPASIDAAAAREVPLALSAVPSREDLQRQAQSDNRYEAARAKNLLAELDRSGAIAAEYPYPITYWRLGDRLDWVFLGGEVVVDYALRLKQVLGPDNAWITAYSNDVMAYIPSRRVLDEGGYEGGGAMLYYGLPSPWAADVEERVIAGVRGVMGEHLPEPHASGPSPPAPLPEGEGGSAVAPIKKLDADKYEMPRVLDERLALELAVAEPDLMTPTGVAVDRAGRVYVVENHTHFPPADYAGPKHDRIRLYADTDGDGQLDAQSTFYEGCRDTVNLCLRDDGWLYVACRAEIFRVRDDDGDGRAERREPIAKLETAGNYPHNGLLGGVFDAGGDYYFGLGENLGAPYKLIGTDGAALSGGGEGGSLYRCAADGSRLQRVATGFWNPHQQAIDRAGRLFAIDNDPDSRPPCRLLHIVPRGDYGYRYRNGRRGIHPFTAWNGELPGTLPMAAGTGEAPSGIVCYVGAGLPAEYRDALLVTSWGDHRIERYRAQPRGASVQAVGELIVVGGESFRPVDIATAPDGSLWISDWVDKSYELHGKGRLWRLRWKTPSEVPAPLPPSLSADEQRAAALRDPSADVSRDERLAALASADPFLGQAAWVGLSGQLSLDDWIALAGDADRWRRLAAILALRESTDPRAAQPLAALLTDADPDVRFAAVQWVGESRLAAHRPALEALLAEPQASRELLEGALAALEQLDGVVREASSEFGGADYLVQRLDSGRLPKTLLARTVRMIPPEHAWLTLERLQQFSQDADSDLRLEAIRSLRESPLPGAREQIAHIAADEARPLAERLESVCGVSPVDGAGREMLLALARSDEAALRDEAWRALRGAELDAAQREALSQTPPADAELAGRVLHAATTNPGKTAMTEARGDAERGQRLFFHPRGPRCYRCHAIEGRGGRIGPELSTAGAMPSERLIAALLDPSREVSPQFVSWSLELTDGRTVVGMVETEDPQGNRVYLTGQGERVPLHVSQIASQAMLSRSVMPDDLAAQLTEAELRDLVAYLGSLR